MLKQKTMDKMGRSKNKKRSRWEYREVLKKEMRSKRRELKRIAIERSLFN
jgi:hypothetical protein